VKDAKVTNTHSCCRTTCRAVGLFGEIIINVCNVSTGVCGGIAESVLDGHEAGLLQEERRLAREAF
jgi:hypothetical protein